MQKIDNQIKVISAAYVKVIDHIQAAIESGRDRKVKFFSKVERQLDKININKKKAAGMYTNDICKMSKRYSSPDPGRCVTCRADCIIKTALMKDGKRKRFKNIYINDVDKPHQNAHPYKSLFDSLREY